MLNIEELVTIFVCLVLLANLGVAEGKIFLFIFSLKLGLR